MSTDTIGNHGCLPELSNQAIKELCQVFKLLSDETRLHILFYLTRESELNVTELCGRLSQSQPAVSHHLALMRVAGIIEPRRVGKHNYYSVCKHHVRELILGLLKGNSGDRSQFRFNDLLQNFEG